MELRLYILLIINFLSAYSLTAQTKIIFRADDMGFSHAANMACVDAYKKGVVRTVEVIVPGPWFEEAVQLLEENPGLDVGVHLALTSEWRLLKWKPLTHAPSLVDEHGYFFPIIWPREDRPGAALKDHDWKIEEVERELRAQIEMAIKRIPQVTHFTGHMGCSHMSEEVTDLTNRLAREYGIDIVPEDHGYERLPTWGGKAYDHSQKLDRLSKVLKNLPPGKYLTVTHPAYDTQETRQVHHIGYENVAQDRDSETKVLMDPALEQLLQQLGIEVIGYGDLR